MRRAPAGADAPPSTSQARALLLAPSDALSNTCSTQNLLDSITKMVPSAARALPANIRLSAVRTSAGVRDRISLPVCVGRAASARCSSAVSSCSARAVRADTFGAAVAARSCSRGERAVPAGATVSACLTCCATPALIRTAAIT